MNWSQREAWERMLDLVKESHIIEDDMQRNNKLLEAVVYGIGTLICKEEKNGKSKRQASRCQE